MVPKGIEKLSTGIRVCVCECVLARSLTLMDGGGKKKKKKKNKRKKRADAPPPTTTTMSTFSNFFTRLIIK